MKQYSSIDIFKLFAAILIVAIHTHPFYGAGADYYITCFCRVGVPFFFVATSFFFFRKPDADIKKYNKRMITLYVLWFVIELPIVYYRFFVEFDHSLPLQIANAARSFVFSNTWGASWYIMACIISVNIIHKLSRRWSNNKLLALAGGGYFISLLAGCYYGTFIQLIGERLTFLFQAFCWVCCPTNSFIVALIYIVAGKVVAENEQRVCEYSSKHRGLLLSVLLGVMMIGAIEVYTMEWSVRVNDTFIFLLPLTCLLVVFLMGSNIGISKETAKCCRNLSILIYLIHPALTYINKAFDVMKGNGMTFFVIVLAMSMVLASVIIILSRRYPILRKLY